jgi:hypothetical protein
MNGKQRKEEFLAKAQEAEQQAEKAKDFMVRESWRRIAESYRDLARRQPD